MSFRRVAAALLLFGAACNGGDDDEGGMPDATTGMDASSEADMGTAPVVEIGIGQDEFNAVAEGQTVMLAQGSQGGGRLLGYHIWSAVRVKGLNPSDASVEFVLLDQDGNEQARQPRQISLQPQGEFFAAYGFAPRIQDCCAIANRMATMRVRVEDSDGLSGEDERTVMAGPCIDMNTGANQCP
jgi:hypothetical protein